MGCCCSCCKCCRKKEDASEAPRTKSRTKSGRSGHWSGPRSYHASMKGYDFGYMTVSSADSNPSVSNRSTQEPIFVGIFDYSPGSNAMAELSVKEGDQFRLTGNPEGDPDPEWLFVMRVKPGENRRWSGYVPKAYVAPSTSLDVFPWYFGHLAGEEAEKLLTPLPDSSFLVRKRPVFAHSISPTGKSVGSKKLELNLVSSVKYSVRMKAKDRSDYVLCVKRDGKIFHRPIYLQEEPRAVFIVQGNNYSSIPELIKELCENPDAAAKHQLAGGQSVLKGWPKKKPPVQLQLSVVTQRKWREIPRSQITLGEVKGGGHFGVVHAATWKTPDGKSIQVAVKALRKGSMRAKQKFIQEAVTMKNLSHKNLVRLYGIVSDKEPFWIVTEYVKDGSLRVYLEKRRERKQLLPEKILIDVCLQICDGMRYLESKQVVHRDLAARNILVSEESSGPEPVVVVKVADFGLARLIEPSKTESERKIEKLPTKWTAPEVLQDNLYSTASDVWSFGIVVHEVFSHGQEPYGVLQHNAVRNFVLKNRQIIRQHPTVPNKVYEIMKQCLRYDPKQRPTFNSLYALFYSYYRKPGETSVKER